MSCSYFNEKISRYANRQEKLFRKYTNHQNKFRYGADFGISTIGIRNNYDYYVKVLMKKVANMQVQMGNVHRKKTKKESEEYSRTKTL